MDELETKTVVLHVTDRPDGGLRVMSDDMRGLFLGGSDRERIWSLVGPSVERLLRHNHGMDVVRLRGPMIAPATAGDVVLEVEHRVAKRRSAA